MSGYDHGMNDPKQQSPPREPRTAAGRSLWESIAENERLSLNGTRMGEYLTAILAIEAAAAGAPLREALEHARKYANRIYDRREWSESDLLEIIHATDDALEATPAPAPLDVERPKTMEWAYRYDPNLERYAWTHHHQDGGLWSHADTRCQEGQQGLHARLTARAAATEDTDA